MGFLVSWCIFCMWDSFEKCTNKSSTCMERLLMGGGLGSNKGSWVVNGDKKTCRPAAHFVIIGHVQRNTLFQTSKMM